MLRAKRANGLKEQSIQKNEQVDQKLLHELTKNKQTNLLS